MKPHSYTPVFGILIWILAAVLPSTAAAAELIFDIVGGATTGSPNSASCQAPAVSRADGRGCVWYIAGDYTDVNGNSFTIKDVDSVNNRARVEFVENSFDPTASPPASTNSFNRLSLAGVKIEVKPPTKTNLTFVFRHLFTGSFSVIGLVTTRTRDSLVGGAYSVKPFNSNRTVTASASAENCQVSDPTDTTPACLTLNGTAISPTPTATIPTDKSIGTLGNFRTDSDETPTFITKALAMGRITISSLCNDRASDGVPDCTNAQPERVNIGQNIYVGPPGSIPSFDALSCAFLEDHGKLIRGLSRDGDTMCVVYEKFVDEPGFTGLKTVFEKMPGPEASFLLAGGGEAQQAPTKSLEDELAGLPNGPAILKMIRTLQSKFQQQ